MSSVPIQQWMVQSAYSAFRVFESVASEVALVLLMVGVSVVALVSWMVDDSGMFWPSW